jgi:ABC-type oligopeptide transport system substrate-binding subunit
MVMDGEYAGLADFAFLPNYFDPNPFLDPFLTVGSGNPTGWTDGEYRTMLADANRTLQPNERMAKLANCERRLLAAMPFIPTYFDKLEYLVKPFVKGLTSNVFDLRSFKYTWIDRDWKPERS